MKLNMRFDTDEENLYKQSTIEKDIKHLRYTYTLFIVLYSIFAYVDHLVAQEYLKLFLTIRFAVVVPVFIITIALTFHKRFYIYYQWLNAFNFFIAGFGITVMMMIFPENFSYYGGMFIVIFSGYFMITLDLIYSFISGILLLFVFTIAMVLFSGLTWIQLIPIFIFLYATNFIGVFGTYHLERGSRRNFIQNKKILETSEHLNALVNQQVQEIYESQTATIYALAKLAESRDSETGKHIEHVGAYCEIITKNISHEYYRKHHIVREDFIDKLRLASALHDIGKVGIIDSILNKPGPLTHEEFSVMTHHTIIGSQTLESLIAECPGNTFLKMGIDVTRHHHEWYDGTGYPDKLKELNIPLSARVVALADVYDALISQRPYKEAFSHNKAVKIISEHSGTQFDPYLVKIFLDHETEFENIKIEISKEIQNKEAVS
jgi:response regulator RpfG family c-di-GMP phosphodiesterase